jgi:hypothetical protein
VRSSPVPVPEVGGIGRDADAFDVERISHLPYQ